MDHVKIIDIHITGNFPFQLEITSDKGDRQVFSSYTNSQTYPEQIRIFYEGLRIFLNMAAAIIPGDSAAAGRAMEQLHLVGRAFAHELFGQDMFDIQDLLRQLNPFWQQSAIAQGPGAARPPVLKLSGLGSLHLPLEFLPLYDLEWGHPVSNADDLARACARFTGFATVVCRHLYDVPGKTADAFCDGRIPNASGLNVRFFHHQQLQYAMQEKLELGAMPDVNVREPWSQALPDHNTYLHSFCEQLLDSPDDHIQHLACHAETQGSDVRRHHLEVSYPGTDIWGNPEEKNGSVYFDELRTHFAAGGRKSKERTYPLIFMNACSAAWIDPMATSSFPTLFHQNRNRGFIAPELPVPDGQAYRFSMRFYEHLIMGKNLCFAMHEAKTDLLNQQTCPLGIIYTIYANPWLRVDRPATTGAITAPVNQGYIK